MRRMNSFSPESGITRLYWSLDSLKNQLGTDDSMKITTAMVKELRDESGAGILDSKKALEASNGNFEEALKILRQKGAVKAAERADREAIEGVIEVYSHPGSRVGVLLELNSETDFVARNQKFKELAHDLVLHVAAMQPLYLKREDVPQNVIDAETEQAQSVAKGKPDRIVEKIIEGRLQKYYEEYCLLEQAFVKNDEVKVKELITNAVGVLGENILIRRFARFELGEERK